MPRLRSGVRASFPAPDLAVNLTPPDGLRAGKREASCFPFLSELQAVRPWRDSKAVMQRIANPSSPVRLRVAPPSNALEPLKLEAPHRRGFFLSAAWAGSPWLQIESAVWVSQAWVFVVSVQVLRAWKWVAVSGCCVENSQHRSQQDRCIGHPSGDDQRRQAQGDGAPELARPPSALTGLLYPQFGLLNAPSRPLVRHADPEGHPPRHRPIHSSVGPGNPALSQRQQ